VPACGDDKIFALFALGVGEVRVEIAQRQPAKATCRASSCMT